MCWKDKGYRGKCGPCLNGVYTLVTELDIKITNTKINIKLKIMKEEFTLAMNKYSHDI